MYFFYFSFTVLVHVSIVNGYESGFREEVENVQKQMYKAHWQTWKTEVSHSVTHVNSHFSDLQKYFVKLTSLLLSARAPVPEAFAFSAMATNASSSNFSFA